METISQENDTSEIKNCQNEKPKEIRVNTVGQQNYTDFLSPRIPRKDIKKVVPLNPDDINRGLSRDFLTLACYNAIATGQIGLLKAVYKTGKAPQVDKQGNTPLHIASRCGQLRSLRWLLQYSSTPIQAKNGRGETPLHVASLHGHLKCLQALVASEKDNVLNILCERDNMGMTVLHHATIGNRDISVAWLAEEFGKDLCLVKSVDGVLAIHLAAAAGNLFCTQVLAEVCVQTVQIRDMFGATPAFYAAQEGHLPCLEYLVEEAGSNLGLVACEGMTAVLTACEGGHSEVLKYIIYKQGSCVLLESTNDGATVFHYVAGNGHYDILQYLLEEVRDTSDVLRLCDTNDRSPAHDAAENGHVNCLKIIIDAGMSIYQPDKDGETPLSLALKSGNPDCSNYAKAVSETTMNKNTFKQMKKMMGSKFPHISNIVNIHALSKGEAKTFKNPKPVEWNGTIPNNLLQQKKKVAGNMDTVENENLSIKSDGIYVWPSWHRSLISRRTNRPASRGIFRGEFILLRSSPPGTMTLKNRKMSPQNRNGHLYAQRNRPCPISLPLQKHEYPTRINQMVGEDDLDTDDIERMFKHPLDAIPEDKISTTVNHHQQQHLQTQKQSHQHHHYHQEPQHLPLYQLDEEDENEDGTEEDTNHQKIQKNSQPYKMNILERQYGLQEAKTSFSMFGRRPYRRNRPMSASSTSTEDYSSDESGISTESGISSHSDNDDKTGYSPSSSDESATSKRYSDSCDSAIKDSYCISSDDDDDKFIKRKRGESTTDNSDLGSKQDSQTIIPTNGSPCNSDLDSLPTHTNLITKALSKPIKAGKRPMRNVPRKRPGTMSSSDEEGFGTISSSFTCLNRTVVANIQNEVKSIQEATHASSLPSSRRESQNSCTVPESLASVLQKSMAGGSNLKSTLRNNSIMDNTCKTVFNSASLSRERRKSISRSDKTTTPRKCSSFRTDISERQIALPLPKPEDKMEMTNDSGTYSSSDEKHGINDPCKSVDSTLDMDNKLTSRLTDTLESDDKISSASQHDDDSHPHQKTASKIKALQNVLIKQSLPFANPVLMKTMRETCEEQPTKKENIVQDEKQVPVGVKDIPVNGNCGAVPSGIPPPPPPPPTSSVKSTARKSTTQTQMSTLPRKSKSSTPPPRPTNPPVTSTLVRSSSTMSRTSSKLSRKSSTESTPSKSTTPPPRPPLPAILSTTLPKARKASSEKCVSYATTTKVETGKDDCHLDDATKTRIACIKSMLERATTVDDTVVDKTLGQPDSSLAT